MQCTEHFTLFNRLWVCIKYMSTVGFKLPYFKGSSFGVGRKINGMIYFLFIFFFMKLTANYQHQCHCAKDMIQCVYIESFISLPWIVFLNVFVIMST